MIGYRSNYEMKKKDGANHVANINIFAVSLKASIPE